MRIGVIGINHKSADLKLREKLAKTATRRFAPDASTHSSLSYILLSTCNRTEIYFSSENLADSHSYILGVLRQDIEEEFEHRIYAYFGLDCFFHLAHVTSGMDSAIIAETEIQGQVKCAYEAAQCYCSLSAELHYLFQKSLKIGKNVRTTTNLERGLPSMEESIFKAGNDLFPSLPQRRVLFVGISTINRKIYSFLKQKGMEKITFCNRSFEKAHMFAQKEGVELLLWDHLEKWHHFDLVIFGTKSSRHLVSRTRAQDPTLVIDLCVPRNVDPKLGRHPKVTLLNVDQLNRTLDRKKRAKATEVARIEGEVILDAVQRHVALFKMRQLQRHAFVKVG